MRKTTAAASAGAASRVKEAPSAETRRLNSKVGWLLRALLENSERAVVGHAVDAAGLLSKDSSQPCADCSRVGSLLLGSVEDFLRRLSPTSEGEPTWKLQSWCCKPLLQFSAFAFAHGQSMLGRRNPGPPAVAGNGSLGEALFLSSLLSSQTTERSFRRGRRSRGGAASARGSSVSAERRRERPFGGRGFRELSFAGEKPNAALVRLRAAGLFNCESRLRCLSVASSAPTLSRIGVGFSAFRRGSAEKQTFRAVTRARCQRRIHAKDGRRGGAEFRWRGRGGRLPEGVARPRGVGDFSLCTKSGGKMRLRRAASSF